jgi:hypothetical protein
MSREFKRGERVRWDAVNSEKSGATAVHKPDAIHTA